MTPAERALLLAVATKIATDLTQPCSETQDEGMEFWKINAVRAYEANMKDVGDVAAD